MVFLLTLALGMIVVGLAAQRPQIISLAIPLLVYIGLALNNTPENPRWHIRRELSDSQVQVGDQITLTLTLVNEGEAVKELWIHDSLPPELHLIEGETTRLLSLLPEGTHTWEYQVKGGRGVYTFAPLQIWAGETFGLFRQGVTTDAQTEVTVMPAYTPIRSLPIRPARTIGFAGPIPSRQSGTGVDFFGVRPYQPGDPLRRINWRATARYMDLPISTEFEQERLADVGIILDMRRQSALALRGRSLLEYMVPAAAAVADRLLQDGHRVGLMLYGQGIDWVTPGYGKIQRERILLTLAKARPTQYFAFENLNYLPTRLFPARSQLIFISPLVSEDEEMIFLLRAHGYMVLLISPDPIAFEQDGIPPHPYLEDAVRLAHLERRLLLSQLEQGGITVINWPVQQELGELIHSVLGHSPPPRLLRGARL